MNIVKLHTFRDSTYLGYFGSLSKKLLTQSRPIFKATMNFIAVQWCLEVGPFFIFSFFSHSQVMPTSTHSSLKCWLLRKRVDSLSWDCLPSKQNLLSLYLFHHVMEKKTVSEGLNLACDNVLTIWERARILAWWVDTCVKKL